MIWAMMQHLGYNMWHDEAIWTPPGRMKWSNFCTDHMLTSKRSWARRMDRLLRPDSRTNTLVIDVGEGVVYPSHPEIAIKGSWTAEELNAEVKRLKAAGLTVVPKLNFSTCHDFWLGDYARMISSPTYYKVVREIIDDTCAIFENPPYFQIGMDEEGLTWSGGNAYCVWRADDLWWHDIAFYGECIGRHGGRPWMFSNPGKRDLEKFVKRLPREFLHTPWSYAETFEKATGDKDFDTGDRTKAFRRLAEEGLDLVPCGSVWCGKSLTSKGTTLNVKNYPNLVRWFRKHIDPARVKGFWMVPWIPSTEGSDGRFISACDLTDIAAEIYEG